MAVVARGNLTQWSTYSRSIQRACGSIIGLGLAMFLITAEAENCVAQDSPTDTVPIGPQPLTVRPRKMATGTRNPRAGEYALDSLEDHLVYVPPKCVGTRRCPLVVFLHPGVESSRYVMHWQRPVADKYGMIVLAPNSPTSWLRKDVSDSVRYKTADYRGQKKIDAAITQVLRKFAIDPNRIALIGYSASGAPTIVIGGYSLDVFSRIIVISAGYTVGAGVDPRNKTTEFLFVDNEESRGNFLNVRELRRDGHPVKQVIGLRSHAMRAEDYDFLGHWLRVSWTTPNPAARPAPSVVTDSIPLLTTDVVTKMTTFWSRFQQEPESIRTTARLAHLREVVVPIGEERPSVVMVDLPALAAKYPSVAVALTAAGLTAGQHEAYRIALISARVSRYSGDKGVPNALVPGFVEYGLSPVLQANSAQAKNLEFMIAHSDEFMALGKTQMWYTP